MMRPGFRNPGFSFLFDHCFRQPRDEARLILKFGPSDRTLKTAFLHRKDLS